ncbi:hypothetical protein GKD64_03800 [Parabacteroides distasonis]|uniref:Uncharacterized protein n=1 Tax=Parabacteroides distasonis TaxID=823 RepID=A0A6I2MX53_PARDI|nr:hypothetical protein [Parabacteroides distasonis]MSI13827.1 hypothetical protein [Escherichia coli]MRY57065.1 hypothetical protein [Parabacteroides distasonis]MRY66252.1 hypothetical protein [Parabacteroides distasonis]MRZ62882.1 hypothetical protein [Parabacteroides distasonis]
MNSFPPDFFRPMVACELPRTTAAKRKKQVFFSSYKDKEKLIGRQIWLPKYSLL